jgi:hypothetical protein
MDRDVCFVNLYALAVPPRARRGYVPHDAADAAALLPPHFRVARTAAQDAARGAEMLAWTRDAAARSMPPKPHDHEEFDNWVNPQLMAVADPPGGDMLWPGSAARDAADAQPGFWCWWHH